MQLKEHNVQLVNLSCYTRHTSHLLPSFLLSQKVELATLRIIAFDYAAHEVMLFGLMREASCLKEVSCLLNLL